MKPADLKPTTASAEPHLFEHRPPNDPDGDLCARCGNRFYNGPHRSPEGVMRELESLRTEVASKYLTRASLEDAEVGRAVEQLRVERDTARKEKSALELKLWKAEDRLRELEVVLTPQPDDEHKDAVSELSAVLWFLASLTSDHAPGCAVKEGDGQPCDCEVLLPEGSEWRARVRGALRLLGKLRVEQAKASILSCNGCGDPLKSGEMMVCKQCSELLDLKQTVRELKSARRIVQVKPVAGREQEFGPWVGVDYALPGSERSVLVVRLPLENVAPYAHEQLAQELRKRLPKTTEVLLTRDGVELTILELP